MSQLICEMCGSADLLKQDGVFVCQSCGCKYSVEEAKKMMAEGTAAVTEGSVKAGTTDELANLYQLARRARDNNDSENAVKFYGMILVKDPNSWEAAFYNVYFRAMSCKIAEIESAAHAIENCLGSVFLLIRDYVPKEEQASAVGEVTLKSASIAVMFQSAAGDHLRATDPCIRSEYKQEFCDRQCAARDILYTCGDKIEEIFDGDDTITAFAAEAWKIGITIHKGVHPSLQNEKANRGMIYYFAKRIEKYDKKYTEELIKNDQIAVTEKKIAELEQQIRNTPVEAKRDGGTLALGIVFIIFAIAFFILSLLTSVGWALFGIGFLFPAVFLIKASAPSKEQQEKNKAIVDGLQEQLRKEKDVLATWKGDWKKNKSSAETEE